jgi:ankyrin repeat protein
MRSSFDKSNYKFISFQKASNNVEPIVKEVEVKESSSIKEAQEFYLNLINEPSSDKHNNQKQTINNYHKNTLSNEIKTKYSPKTKRIANLNKNGYLKAAQTDDLNYIKQYLDLNLTLNELDDYKWNVLMIAIASSNNDIVKYLLETQTNKSDFSDLINWKDMSGNDPESLAIRFNNKQALELIQKAKQMNVNNVNKNLTENINELCEKKSDNYYCDVCKQTYDSYLDHIKSIPHQLNENENQPVSLKANYYLRPSNKGYQLLMKSGWNESSGLGLKEQGDTRPIRTRVKLDRLGIGISNDDKDAKTIITTRSKRVFELKQNDSEKKSHERIEDVFKRAKLAEKSKKKITKSKNFDRNYRYYFNN